MTFLEYVQKVANHFFQKYLDHVKSAPDNTSMGALNTAISATKDLLLVFTKSATITHKEIETDVNGMKALIMDSADAKFTIEKAVELRTLLWENGDKFLTGVSGYTTSAACCFLLASYMDIKEEEMKHVEEVKRYTDLRKANAANPKSLKDEKSNAPQSTKSSGTNTTPDPQLIAKKHAYAGNFDKVIGAIKTFFPEESYSDAAKKWASGNWDKQCRYFYNGKNSFSDEAQKTFPKVNPGLPWQLQPAFAWLYLGGEIPEHGLTTVIEAQAGINKNAEHEKDIAKLTADHKVAIIAVTSKDAKSAEVQTLLEKAATQKASDDKRITELMMTNTKLQSDHKLELEKANANQKELQTKLAAQQKEMADAKAAFEKMKTELEASQEAERKKLNEELLKVKKLLGEKVSSAPKEPADEKSKLKESAAPSNSAAAAGKKSKKSKKKAAAKVGTTSAGGMFGQNGSDDDGELVTAPTAGNDAESTPSLDSM